MKPILFLLALLLVSPAARADDFTVEWEQPINASVDGTTILDIGNAKVVVKSVPPAKKNDPPRYALFVDGAPALKTPLYADRTYFFAVTRKDGKLQWFVNGFADGPASDKSTPGERVVHGVKATSTNAARTPDEILQRFKTNLRTRDITTVAHRGVHAHAPENTRISYVQAVEARSPIIELDTALTKDGQIVLMHDKTVDRTTNGKGPIAELTLDEVRKLDAGAWKDAKYKGEPVPTLAEIDDVSRGKSIMMLDLKATGQGKQIAAWLAESKRPIDQVILAPWTVEEGADLRKYVADVPMILLHSKLPTKSHSDDELAALKAVGFSGFSIDWRVLTPAFVDAAHKNGMKVYVWTLNEAPDIAGAALLGVDGIVTDDPAVTIKLLAQLKN